MSSSRAPSVSSLDLPSLCEWMDAQGLESGPITNVIPLSGGTQNVIARFSKGSRDFVIRKPTSPRGSKAMMREARVLKALRGSDVPAPEFIAACEDDEILGAAFYLMAPIDGYNLTDGMPAEQRDDPALRREMGFSLVEGAAALSKVDFRAVGLGDFGKLENYLGRQSSRWMKQLEGYREYSGWPGLEGLPGVTRIADWIAANVPADFQPGIIHGDYHFANVMFQPHGGKLAAIIDWELTTIGDPLQDLGLVLATWPDSEGRGGTFDIEPWSGFPTSEELAAHYAEITGRDLSCLRWFVVLACYKEGIILEGTYARAFGGKASREVGDYLHGLTVRFFNRALELIEAS